MTCKIIILFYIEYLIQKISWSSQKSLQIPFTFSKSLDGIYVILIYDEIYFGMLFSYSDIIA